MCLSETDRTRFDSGSLDSPPWRSTSSLVDDVGGRWPFASTTSDGGAAGPVTPVGWLLVLSPAARRGADDEPPDMTFVTSYVTPAVTITSAAAAAASQRVGIP